MVAPRARRVNVARGGMVSRVIPAFQLVSVVAMPCISNARALSPTTHFGKHLNAILE